MIKKTKQFVGLNELDTYIVDSKPLSPEFFDVTYLPKTLHSGKNIIRIRANDDTLKPETPLYIEVLDFNGDPIYFEHPNYLYEDKSRLITIYIYDDTPPGEAQITIMGESVRDLDGNPIPLEWQNKPNVKWQSTFVIDTTRRNESEILFEDTKLPFISIEEKIRPQLDRLYTTTQYATQSGIMTYRLNGTNPSVTITDGTTLTEAHLGAVIKITPTGSSPTVPDTFSSLSQTYWTTIQEIQTEKNATLSEKYYLDNELTNRTYTAVEMSNSSYEIHFENEPDYRETENSASLALISVNGLDNVSGEVHRVKAFYKSRGQVGGWQLAEDIVVKESDYNEILIDTESIDVKTKLGYIKNQAHIDTYWDANVYTRGGNNIIDPPSLKSVESILFNNSDLKQSMVVDNTTMTFVDGIDFIRVTPQSGQEKTFEVNGQYDFTITSLGVKSTQVGNNTKPYIEFYMSGSSFSTKKDETGLGKKIGEFNPTLDYPGNSSSTFRYENRTFTFEADGDGTGVIVMKINSGDWYLSDISITPSYEKGFNPCQTKILIPIPTNHINDQLDFKVEYYDFQNNQADHVSYCDTCEFAGGNTYIGGNTNIMTGSLYVSNGASTGVHLFSINGGLVRSVGYTGCEDFTQKQDPITYGPWSGEDTQGNSGFVIYSGSDMGLLSHTGETYNGVGIEMVAPGSSFKYTTENGGSLEIITDTFFLGNDDAFISGSNGQIEIVSQNGSGPDGGGVFHLQPTGEITSSGAFITFPFDNGTSVEQIPLINTVSGYTDGMNIGRVHYQRPVSGGFFGSPDPDPYQPWTTTYGPIRTNWGDVTASMITAGWDAASPLSNDTPNGAYNSNSGGYRTQASSSFNGTVIQGCPLFECAIFVLPGESSIIVDLQLKTTNDAGLASLSSNSCFLWGALIPVNEDYGDTLPGDTLPDVPLVLPLKNKQTTTSGQAHTLGISTNGHTDKYTLVFADNRSYLFGSGALVVPTRGVSFTPGRLCRFVVYATVDLSTNSSNWPSPTDFMEIKNIVVRSGRILGTDSDVLAQAQLRSGEKLYTA